MIVLSKLIHRFIAIPIKIPAGFLAEIDKIILEFMWKCERSRIVKIILKKKNKVRGPLNFKNLLQSYSNQDCMGTSLVVQWLRIHLPMQGTWVQSLVREDPTCHGATKPVRHNY